MSGGALPFVVFPAIDLADGKAVRLLRGERSRRRVVADDPVALALRLQDQGATFLHLVDLDAAFGDGDNHPVLRSILAAVSCPVQVGGGVRSRRRVAQLIGAGAARVVLGTAAVRDPELLEALLVKSPETVVVAADTRAGAVTVAGWTAPSGKSLAAFAADMRRLGVRHLLVTAVERDGTGEGPDHVVLRQALAAFGPGVIASGGVGSVEDVRRLAPLAAEGLAGVIVGSLLVDGHATVAELHAAALGEVPA
jgi:phosphoribosylformimino-5-aminoimidazole carboxamide ribotide isomerase